MSRRRWFHFLAGLGLGWLLVSLWFGGPSVRSQPAPAATGAQLLINPRQVAEALYPELPDFPKENNYIRQDNRRPAPESTLLERFIVYHTTVKGRSPLSRFDWLISLADYLGVNDFLRPETYPGRTYLTTNPMEQDVAAIRQLNRQQRQALVNTLTAFYARQAGLPTTTPQLPQTEVLPQPVPRNSSGSVLPPIPQPGGATLLTPAEPPRPQPTGDARFLLP
ncbi:hypothetical protein [Parathermosynechococcus lividus]